MKTLSQPLVEGLNGHIPSRETAFSTSIVARSERWEYFLRRNSLSSSEIRFVQKRSKQCERQPGVAGAPGPVKQRSEILQHLPQSLITTSVPHRGNRTRNGDLSNRTSLKRASDPFQVRVRVRTVTPRTQRLSCKAVWVI